MSGISLQPTKRFSTVSIGTLRIPTNSNPTPTPTNNTNKVEEKIVVLQGGKTGVLKKKQMATQKYVPRAPTGMVDIPPEQMPLRRQVFDIIRQVFRQHGAEEIETPVCELKETLTGKYGEDSKLVYDLEDQGGELLSLRYDLTVPFARFLAVNEQIVKMRRFQIARVYRRDTARVNKGRFREFYQCDFDCAGVYADMVPDAECLKICSDVLERLNFKKYNVDYEIKVNHRDLLDGVFALCQVPPEQLRQICSAVDKLDKEPWETVFTEMTELKGLPVAKAEMLGRFVSNKVQARDLSFVETLCNTFTGPEFAKAKERCASGIASLRKLFSFCDLMKVPSQRIQFDLSMARGLDYYTGVIYEVVLLNDNVNEDVGSVAGGGRYDKLVGMFSNKDIPCVGISLGVERLITVLLRLKQNEQPTSEVQVLVSGMDDAKFDSLVLRMQLCAQFWEENVCAEFPQEKKKQKLVDQFTTCERDRIPILVYFGSSEAERKVVKIRQMFHDKRDAQGRVERVEHECAMDDMVATVQRLLREMDLA